MRMTRAEWAFLFALGLGVALGIAFFQHSPGYMDADYYLAGAVRLAQGRGFSEIFPWNYLDDFQRLPHPSHGYWMPLASLVAALPMALTGQLTFSVARLPFILLAACVPPLTALLALRLTSRRELALLSGLLAAFSTYQAPFIATIDNFVLYNLLGASFFLLLTDFSAERAEKNALLLGIIAGLMHLARAEGLLWLPLALLALFWLLRRAPKKAAAALLTLCLGYLLVMAPWFWRNWREFGALLAPGGSRALWLTSYDQTFLYPASGLTLQNWLASGAQAILQTRLWALGQNLATAFAAQGGILLSPLILLGFWRLRRHPVVIFGGLAWLGLLLFMSLLFPFAGVRGSFFHSGAALMPLGWALAPLGLDALVSAARARGWFDPHAFRVFRLMLLALNAALTLVLLNFRVINTPWDASALLYARAEETLQRLNAPPEIPVMVANPPGFYLAGGRAAIALPVAKQPDALQLMKHFGVRYLLLEGDSLTDWPRDLYAQRETDHFRLTADLGSLRIYEILP
ncbi:MAG: hypothetical protein Fur0035_17850 [Anaerolineales bacterium]